AKHVDPLVEDWRTRVQIPPSPPIQNPGMKMPGFFIGGDGGNSDSFSWAMKTFPGFHPRLAALMQKRSRRLWHQRAGWPFGTAQQPAGRGTWMCRVQSPISAAGILNPPQSGYEPPPRLGFNPVFTNTYNSATLPED